MISPASVLITGVAGFIGSHLAEQLIRDGHRVLGIDCFTDYYDRSFKERNLENLRRHDHFTLLETDLLDLDLHALLNRGWINSRATSAIKNASPGESHPIEFVFHLGAQPGVRGSWGPNFQIYVRNNIVATQRLLEAAKKVPLKKFVYASSSSVYGNAECFPTSERVTPHPISPYGVTKLAAEHLCLLYWRNYAVPAVAPRYFTVYGPRQRPDMAFHRFINAMLKGEPISVYGDGEQTRDFTFVSDAVGGTLRAAFGECVGEVFNIGGGSRVTINQVIQTLEKILERQARTRYLEPQRGDARHTAADIRHAQALLGYKPTVSLEHGLCLQVRQVKLVMEEVKSG